MLSSPVMSLFDPWTAAHQAPLSGGFSRQEYWSGLSFPTPGDLSDPGIEPASLVPPTLAGGFTTEPLGKPQMKRQPPTHTQHLASLYSGVPNIVLGQVLKEGFPEEVTPKFPLKPC